jgi:hypothetical protein
MRAAIVATTLLLAAAASADDFAARGRNVVVVEGLVGVGSYGIDYPDDNSDASTRVHVGVFGMLPFTRLGYHRFIGRGFSLGTGAQFLKATGTLYYDREMTAWGLTPRVGWSTPIASTTSLWLRAGPGLSYLASTATRTGQVSLGAEAILMFIPARDFGVMMVTFVESGVAGREIVESTNTGRAVRLRTLGVALGVAVAF